MWNRFGKIFNDACERGMLSWDVNNFKRDFPRLYTCIMSAMAHVEQEAVYNLMKEEEKRQYTKPLIFCFPKEKLK